MIRGLVNHGQRNDVWSYKTAASEENRERVGGQPAVRVSGNHGDGRQCTPPALRLTPQDCSELSFQALSQSYYIFSFIYYLGIWCQTQFTKEEMGSWKKVIRDQSLREHVEKPGLGPRCASQCGRSPWAASPIRPARQPQAEAGWWRSQRPRWCVFTHGPSFLQ